MKHGKLQQRWLNVFGSAKWIKEQRCTEMVGKQSVEMQAGQTCITPLDLMRQIHSDKSAGPFSVSIKVMTTLYRSEKGHHSAVQISESWKEITAVHSEHQPVSVCSL